MNERVQIGQYIIARIADGVTVVYDIKRELAVRADQTLEDEVKQALEAWLSQKTYLLCE